MSNRSTPPRCPGPCSAAPPINPLNRREFGRTPVRQQGGRGRDHNATGFTMWMAGGGVAGGTTVGATDEIGMKAISDRAHVNDIHATILHLMGLDHTRLTFLHGGRDERLTDVAGRVLTSLLA